MTEQSPLSTTPFTPTPQDTAGLLEWFGRYDELARRNDVEAMADTARFPLTVTTNDSAGECVTQQWDRGMFVRAMDTSGAAALVNHREPVFLNRDLAVVVTNTTMTDKDQTHHMRYVDVMAKVGGGWRFTSMIQAGWGDMLKEHLGA